MCDVYLIPCFHEGICVYVYVTVIISVYTESSLNSRLLLTTWYKGYKDRQKLLQQHTQIVQSRYSKYLILSCTPELATKTISYLLPSIHRELVNCSRALTVVAVPH